MNAKHKTLLLLVGIPLILSVAVTPNLSFADYNDKPYKQVSKGIKPHEVDCKAGLTEIIRTNGKPACVNHSIATEWDSTGKGKINALLNCKAGAVHLKNPNTGAIICENQSKAQKFVDQGWVALDQITFRDDSPVEQCKGGEIHLQNPNLGTIICENQDQAQKYVNNGWIALDEIPEHTDTGLAKCSGGNIPMAGDSTGTSICVHQDQVQKFVAEGFTPLEDVPKRMDGIHTDLKECKSGVVHLKNPNTGSIICEKQSEAIKYVKEGWVALDKIPGMETITPTICKSGEVKLMNPNTGDIICKNQDQAQKYIDEGWARTDPMTDTISSSEVKTDAAVSSHMVQIEIVDVTVFEGDEPNTYVITIKLTAGDADVTKLRAIVVSDKESLPIDVNHLSAGKDTTSSIRIHADDPSLISANIQSYVLR